MVSYTPCELSMSAWLLGCDVGPRGKPSIHTELCAYFHTYVNPFPSTENAT